MRVGNPEDTEERKRLRRQSPLFSADQIVAPLMVIQGANDPRVKKQESDQIVVALRDRNYPVSYLVAENEGHGFRSRENRLAVAAAMEDFLAEHLDGRSTEETDPEIHQTVQNLTVDPASVTLPDSLAKAQAKAARTAPLPEANGTALDTGSMQYTTTLEMQGREINVDITRKVEQATFEDQSVWRIADQAQTSMGSSTDTVLVDRENLVTKFRSASQGGGTMRVRYSNEMVTGQIQARGQSIDINKKLEAPVLSDGAGLDIFVTGLPLETGYEATLRTFNSQQQQAVPMTLEVTGTETIDVPAGTFDTFVVEITPVEEGNKRTLYVSQEAAHTMVRKQRSLPAQMGGGTATTELTSME